MADSANKNISDKSCEAITRPNSINIPEACRRLAIAVATAIALHTSPVFAQANPEYDRIIAEAQKT